MATKTPNRTQKFFRILGNTIIAILFGTIILAAIGAVPFCLNLANITNTTFPQTFFQLLTPFFFAAFTFSYCSFHILSSPVLFRLPNSRWHNKSKTYKQGLHNKSTPDKYDIVFIGDFFFAHKRLFHYFCNDFQKVSHSQAYRSLGSIARPCDSK